MRFEARQPTTPSETDPRTGLPNSLKLTDGEIAQAVEEARLWRWEPQSAYPVQLPPDHDPAFDYNANLAVTAAKGRRDRHAEQSARACDLLEGKPVRGLNGPVPPRFELIRTAVTNALSAAIQGEEIAKAESEIPHREERIARAKAEAYAKTHDGRIAALEAKLAALEAKGSA